eukprot:GGOE01014321.1.p1 GENE.GGOE01014321.1~~GGOE01014321.1.p1  ORF type:complete len:395 (-),score=96.16 GGOE01014321.1:172-1269(-)
MVNFLPSSWDSAALEALCSQYGPIESCKVVWDSARQRSKGYGFVKFVNKIDAESCLAGAQGIEVEGRRLKLQKAELGKGPAGRATLYVSGFDVARTTDEELRGLFSNYGEVVKVTMGQPQPGKNGVAFVTFEHFAEAQLAVDNLHGCQAGNNVLTVRLTDQTLRAVQTYTHVGTPVAPLPLDYSALLAGPAFALPGGGTAYLTSASALGALPYTTTALQYPYGASGVPMTLAGALPYAALGTASAAGPMTTQRATAAGARFQPYKRPGLKTPKAPQTPLDPSNPIPPNGENGTYCVFLYGIQGLTEDALHSLFAPFGTVTSCRVQPGKNFGFVNMPNYDDAVTAINTLHGTLPGTKIPIQVSLRQ